MKNKKTILIADDHPLLRAGIINIFFNNEKYNKPIEANNGKEALELIIKHKPDLVILDMEMPIMNGIEVCSQIKLLNLQTKILFLTMYKEKDLFDKAIDLGALGYLLKEHSQSEIQNAIDAVLNNQYYFGKDIDKLFVDGRSRILTNMNINSKIALLTKTEKDILLLISQRFITKEIADKLFISEKTVKNHRHNIIEKLKLDGDQNSLLKFAFENIDYFK